MSTPIKAGSGTVTSTASEISASSPSDRPRALARIHPRYHVPGRAVLIVGALAALVALVFNGPTTALIVVGLVVVVQQLEGNVLQPILVGRTLQLHAALVILAVTAGSSLAGIAGAFLAVPVFAVATTVLRYARSQVQEPQPVTAASG